MVASSFLEKVAAGITEGHGQVNVGEGEAQDDFILTRI
jgi:hypothetical protein